VKVEKTKLPGVVVISPTVHGDDRGFFMETFHQADFANAGLPDNFVQDNHSRSAHGVLRGLHFQYPQWQGKLVRVISGEIFDVAVDVRIESPTYGQWVGVVISAENKQQVYVPPGFAHGFCVVSEMADVVYKCTSLYKPADDTGILWNDPAIGIEWPIANPIVSAKDCKAGLLSDLKVR
jgi:dTDP-4-dehydrorhamnose 3,5-epimerase